MKRVAGRLAVMGCALTPFACGSTPTAPGPDDFGVLFIGNSLTYSNDLPEMLERLLELGGVDNPVVAAQAHPNVGLPDHWVMPATLERIRAGGWSVVILQQGPSATEGRPYLLEYAELFAAEIRAVGATPALYMVWPSISRFSDFDGVLDSYRTAADEVDGLFLPAGEAWRVAWEQDSDLSLYGPDGFHPTEMGTYLAALVMYQQLTGRDPTALPPVIPSSGGDIALDPDIALLLQEAAAEANARHAR